MPTYATSAELQAYVNGTSYATRLPADLDRLLELAEADLDGEVFGVTFAPADYGAARVLNPADLDLDERPALSAATCAQAVYRVEMGDEHFVRAQREKVSGRSFSAEGKLPVIGPQAWRELGRAGDLTRLTTSVGGRGHGPHRRSSRWAGWGDESVY